MPEFKPKTRAKSDEILNQALDGDIARYEEKGLFTRAITPKSAYRYRGVFLQYQKALQGKPPSLEASTLRIYRVALKDSMIGAARF